MKKISILLMLLIPLVFSCSKEEENPTQELENFQFSLLEDEDVVDVPQALLSSSDPYAMIAASQIQLAKSLKGLYSGFYQVPNGAKKSTTPITPSNARVAGGTQYLVYTWSSNNVSLAYQLHATTDKYVLEVFIKIQNEDWVKLFYADESKDKKSGQVKFFETFGSGALVSTYTWEIAGDLYKFSMFNTTGNKLNVSVSLTTGAGTLDYYIENELNLTLTWTNQGTGTWVYYGDGVAKTGDWN